MADDDDDLSLEVFQTANGSIELRVDASHDTVWATQKQIAALFECDKSNVTHHIQNIYAGGELDAGATSEETSVVQREGERDVTRPATIYNLDVILAVGYRVSGKKATEFRRWSTSILRAHIEQGYTLNEARLATNPEAQRELAAAIRAIRTSEAEMYLKVRDVFKQSASDYSTSSPTARHFFAMAQDKFHYAVTGKTAFAESKAFRGQTMNMEELQFKLNTLLTANDYQVLYEYGSYDADRAETHVKGEIAKYRQAHPQIEGPREG